MPVEPIPVEPDPVEPDPLNLTLLNLTRSNPTPLNLTRSNPSVVGHCWESDRQRSRQGNVTCLAKCGDDHPPCPMNCPVLGRNTTGWVDPSEIVCRSWNVPYLESGYGTEGRWGREL